VRAQLDENLPRSLATALNEIAAFEGHEIIHVRDLVPSGTPDVELFSAAKRDLVQIHVTQDHHHRRALEREAIARLGLTVFVLAKGWNQFSPYDKAARLIEWWPKMMQLVELTSPGSIFSVPTRHAASGRIRPIKRSC